MSITLRRSELKKNISKSARKWLGIIALVVAIGIIIAAFITNEAVYKVSSVVASIPLFLLSLSLLFGQAQKTNKGIFSKYTLYIMASATLFIAILMMVGGQRRSGFMLGLVFVMVSLARRR